MIEWHEASENNDGIVSIAVEDIGVEGFKRFVGYNGILKGDNVAFEEKEYTVVMVSRMGDFGLSETGSLPYTMRVSPLKVKKIEQ